MNILITGCNGQLGNEIQLLQAQYAQHTWFNTDVNELDITDKAAIERFVETNEIGGIVNCAAYTAVDKAESDPQLARKLNAEAPAFLAEVVGKRGGWMVRCLPTTSSMALSTRHTWKQTSLAPIAFMGKRSWKANRL